MCQLVSRNHFRVDIGMRASACLCVYVCETPCNMVGGAEHDNVLICGYCVHVCETPCNMVGGAEHDIMYSFVGTEV